MPAGHLSRRTTITEGTMATDRIASKPFAVAASALLLGGCVSSSIGSDLTRVRELARVPVLADVAEADVAPATSRQVQAMLGQPLDADTAVRVALLNNRHLSAQLRELGVYRGRLIQAGLVANPVVEAESLPERNSSIELRVEYDVTSLVLAPLRARAAAADLEAARFDAAGAVIQLGYDVRTAFFALQAAEQRLAIAQRSLDAFAAGRDAAAALLEAGNIPALDAATQVAAYERARITVAQIELDVADRREALQRLLGLHGGDTSWRARGGLGPVPESLAAPARPEARALQASLELGAARSRLEAAARRTGLARAQGWLPDVAVDVHALYGDPESAPGSSAAVPWRFGGGVSFTVPLFDRGQGNTRGHEAEFDALMERYQGVAVDIRSAVRETRNRIVSAHGRALHFQRVILPAQKRVVEEMLLQYNAMQVGLFQLLQAQREQLDMELAWVETQREYWSASAALDALLAGRRVTVAATTAAAPINTASESAGGH
jgi:outer membrane protein TolC